MSLEKSVILDKQLGLNVTDAPRVTYTHTTV